MRRLYIVPKSVWLAAANLSIFHRGIGSHYVDVVAAGVMPTTHAAILASMAAAGYDLTTSAGRKSAFTNAASIASNYVLVSTDFASEGPEDFWHGHPHVGIMPSPTFEGTMTIASCVGCPTKRITADHIAALSSHPSLGYESTDTVIDLGGKSATLHPQVKLRAIL